MERPIPDREIEENSEQDDSGAQAQQVADDARVRQTDPAEDSERGGRDDPAQLVPNDMEDLVEKMNAMNRSGHVDMDAYAGEPQMDDEEDVLGQTDEEDDGDDLYDTVTGDDDDLG